jgi:hypothetical protein
MGHRIAAVAVVLAIVPSIVGNAAAGERRTSVTDDCLHASVRPRSIVFACADGGFLVRRLTWHTWHPFRARATGVFHQNDCDPSCAEGEYHTRTGTLRLRGRTWCPGIERYVFDHAVTRFDAPLLGRDRQRFRMFCP